MLGITDYGAFCAATLLFLALPGPGTLCLLTSTGQGGLRAGTAATAGLILGDQVLLWLAVAGVAALLAAQPLLFRGLQYAGAGYLVWIGLRLIFARGGPASAAPALRARGYMRQAFFITLLNPKAIVFYMAFFPLFIDADAHRGAVTFGAMAITIAVISAGYCLLLCVFARTVREKVQAHPRWGRTLERLAGAALLAFGLRMAAP